jgi:cellulose synthase/poly-beta-1,6-N-acetylglucosamine synthase-like glycosyltransferase
VTAFIQVVSIVVFAIMGTYAVRHYRFLWNRLFEPQDHSYQDMAGAYLPSVSIVIPMHNEEAVARGIVECLVDADYPQELMEIIAVNDHSTDATMKILDGLAERHPNLRVIHRTEPGPRGKTEALKAATAVATGEIMLVFDADYRPGRGVVKRLVAPFCDPSVASVMGRVVPSNSADTVLTRLLDLERAGGYQANLQARQNLGLVVQYGGTVGGVRRTVLDAVGGWVPHLTEDTDLTFRIYLQGFRVVYVNLAECYEEVVQNWTARSRQLGRWAQGHNRVMFDYLGATLRSPLLKRRQRIEALLLLGVYVAPVVLLAGWLASIYLFFSGGLWYWSTYTALLGSMSFNTWGNLAAFNEIGSAMLLDRRRRSILLIPLGVFSFFAGIWICTGAFGRAVRERIGRRTVMWDKTPRYAKAQRESA